MENSKPPPTYKYSTLFKITGVILGLLLVALSIYKYITLQAIDPMDIILPFYFM